MADYRGSWNDPNRNYGGPNQYPSDNDSTRINVYRPGDENLTRRERRKTLLKIVDVYSNDIDRVDQPGYRRDSLSGRGAAPSVLVTPPKNKDLAKKVIGFFPIVDVIRTYNKSLLFGDMRSGLTVGITLVLRSIVFATLVSIRDGWV